MKLLLEVLKGFALAGTVVCVLAQITLGLYSTKMDFQMRDDNKKAWWNPFREPLDYKSEFERTVIKAFLGGLTLAACSIILVLIFR
jgi:hypothetical protein